MLAEDEGEKLHDLAFDMTYGWEFHHIMNEVAKKHMNADSIIAYFEREERFASNAYRLHLLQIMMRTHGMELNMNEWVKELSALLSFHQLYGMPLIYNGQESSFNRRLEFFEKDSIDWGTFDKNGFTIHCSILRRKIQHYGMEILAPFLNSSKQETQMCCFLNESRETTVSLDYLIFLNQSKM